MTDIDNIPFDTLGIPIPDVIKTYSHEKQRNIYAYLSEMDELNKNAYKIAYNHLQTSFDICRSNGYKEWVAKQSGSV